MAKGIVREGDCPQEPRYHKSGPRLGQGSEVHVDAHVRKWHALAIRGVGGSWIDAFVVPGRCGARSRSVSVF